MKKKIFFQKTYKIASKIPTIRKEDYTSLQKYKE